MAEKKLKPIFDRDAYSDPIAEEIEWHLWDLIYRPLFAIMREETGLKTNASARHYPLRDLLPCSHNRETDPAKIEKMKQDILLTGTVKPFVVTEVRTDQGKKFMITDGHHRYAALQALIDQGALQADVQVPYVLSGPRGVETADGMGRVLLNSKPDLVRALAAGRVQYEAPHFAGQFNAGISKYLRSLGAEWLPGWKVFKLEPKAIPPEVKVAISISKAKTQEIVDRLNRKLTEIQKQSDDMAKTHIFKEPVQHIFKGLDEQFHKTTAKDFNIPMKTPERIQKVITVEYSENLDLYIKKWREEAIYRLREQVEENVREGFRSDRMIDRIQSENGVSRRKAKFLARQETSLLVSKYREERYKDIGIGKYQWSTSHDARTRHDHKILDGRIFTWNNPPITDQVTGERNNPGEDFNCRCVAIPVFDERWEKEI